MYICICTTAISEAKRTGSSWAGNRLLASHRSLPRMLQWTERYPCPRSRRRRLHRCSPTPAAMQLTLTCLTTVKVKYAEPTAAAPAGKVEAVIRSPTNMAAAKIAAADDVKMTSLNWPDCLRPCSLGNLLANRRLQTLLLFWLDARSLENI